MNNVPDQIIGYVLLANQTSFERGMSSQIYKHKDQADSARDVWGGLVCGLYAFPTHDEDDES